MIAELTAKLPWYVARASGLVTWALCGAAIVWGLVLSTKVIRRRGLPAWLLDLHTFLGTLALVFCAVHLGALALDDYTHWGWSDLFVPMASSWKPGPTAWGIVAFYLLVAVQVTSWLRRRIPKRAWRAVHHTSAVLFVAGTVHGVTAGTDWTNRAVPAVAAVVTCTVAGLTAVRVTSARRRAGPADGPGAAAAGGARAAAARARLAATPGGVQDVA